MTIEDTTGTRGGSVTFSDPTSSKVAHPGVDVLIVDDHKLVATSLQIALRTRGLAAVDADTRSISTILTSARRSAARLVLLNLELGSSGTAPSIKPAELIGLLQAEGRRVLAISARARPHTVAAAVAAGAICCLQISDSFESLFEMIVRTIAGETVMSETDRQEWLQVHRRRYTKRDSVVTGLDRLSLREVEILALLAEGHRAAEIANMFAVELTTVRTQIRSILTKLRVNSQAQAVAIWVARHFELASASH